MIEKSIAEKVFEEIENFFLEGGGDQNLFWIACHGSPERTLQGALLIHLAKKGFHVISEMHFGEIFPDIAVFKDPGSNMPDVLIELKHKSPFQTGGISSLLSDGMLKDYIKHRTEDSPTCPLILLGSATTVIGEDSIRGALTHSNTFKHFTYLNGTSHKKDLTIQRESIKELLKKWGDPSDITVHENFNGIPYPDKSFICVDLVNKNITSDEKCTPLQHINISKTQIAGTVHAIGFLWQIV